MPSPPRSKAPVPSSLEDHQPTAMPPIIDPKGHEPFPTFRETFMVYFTDPAANAATGDLYLAMRRAYLEANDAPRGGACMGHPHSERT